MRNYRTTGKATVKSICGTIIWPILKTLMVINSTKVRGKFAKHQ